MIDDFSSIGVFLRINAFNIDILLSGQGHKYILLTYPINNYGENKSKGKPYYLYQPLGGGQYRTTVNMRYFDSTIARPNQLTVRYNYNQRTDMGH